MPELIPVYKILIIDDEKTISDTLALVFSKRGYQVRVAYSAEEAIEIIAQWQPDAAIIDVMLPRMNGIDLAIVLKENHPACRALLFSGDTGTAEIAEQAARKGHIFEILAKPVHPVFLLERVATLLQIDSTERAVLEYLDPTDPPKTN